MKRRVGRVQCLHQRGRENTKVVHQTDSSVDLPRMSVEHMVQGIKQVRVVVGELGDPGARLGIDGKIVDPAVGPQRPDI